MRKLILSMHMSLDGMVAAPNNDMSWMQLDDNEQWSVLFKFIIKDVDLFLTGRGMWKEYRDHWTKMATEPGNPPNEVKYGKIAVKTPHIVFSKTLKQTGWSNATIASGDLKKTILKLKQQPGKNIVAWGGARFATALIDSGLVDEYRFMIEPIILAKGKSIFNKLSKRRPLQLKEIKKLKNGVAAVSFVRGEKK